MSKLVKIILIAFFLLVSAFFGVRWYVQYWINNRLKEIVNEDPERDYDLFFESVWIDPGYTGLRLLEAKISPVRKDLSSIINGTVKRIELRGFSWYQLVVNESLIVEEIEFEEPIFDVQLTNQDKEDEYEVDNNIGLQNLFGDILSRGRLSDFILTDGAAALEQVTQTDTLMIGSVGAINIHANGIQIDSVQVKNIIPFMMDEFSLEISGIQTMLDVHTDLGIDRFAISSTSKICTIEGVSLTFNKDPLEVSRAIKEQIDLIELETDLIEIRQLDAVSNFFGEEINVQAETLLIDGLNMRDYRDKNQPRPADFEKPMFEGMVEAIKLPLKVDTVQIRNSNISYTELPEGKEEAGTISFNEIFASIYNVTTIEKYKRDYKMYEADIIAKINQEGNLRLRLEVPYSDEYFDLWMDLTNFHMSKMNPTLDPLADIVMNGHLKRMKLTMEAERTYSNNTLIMDYDSLELAILQTEKNVKNDRKKVLGLSSSLANKAIRRRNLPGSRNYLNATYQTTRNVNRGPFNFMWQTVKEGMAQIIVARTVQGLINKKPKEETKKSKNRKKKSASDS